MLFRNWRLIIFWPCIYRVDSNNLRVQSQFLIFLTFFFCYSLLSSVVYSHPVQSNLPANQNYFYNKTYPLTPAVNQSNGVTYAIAIIADLDTNSSVPNQPNKWQSFLKRGYLTWIPSKNLVTVEWEDGFVTLISSLSWEGRGMELSELVTFDGRLLAFDDKTGIGFSIEGDQVYPWVILADGNGKNENGFRCEWATVKYEQLYVGGIGKEWTTPEGEFVNDNSEWIKVISPHGKIHSKNWTSNYNNLKKAMNIKYPGYIIHEAAVWSNFHQKWFFLPRRCSEEQYNETKDEEMGCNAMITADEKFENIKVKYIGVHIPIRGFSSFKFLPGSRDSIIVALKTEEYQGQIATYITAFNIDGQILMPDLKVSDKKFEGLEFV